MDDFDREDPYYEDREIQDLDEAEHIIDKVLSTGQNFYNPRNGTFQSGHFDERPISNQYSDLGSRRSHSMSQRSMRSTNSRKLNQNAGSGRVLRSQRSARSNLSGKSKGSRKSLQAVQDSLNKVRQSNVHNYALNTKVSSMKQKPTVGRTKLGLAGTLNRDVNNVYRMSNAINSKLNTFMTDPSYDKFFKNGSLLKLPSVQRPVVSVVDAGRSTFVANNDAHCKEANFGYSRNKFGGFYNH